MSGVLVDGPHRQLLQGVQVYRNDQITNMDICCLPWESACKPPTGILGMAVAYVRADKAYAVALQGVMIMTRAPGRSALTTATPGTSSA
jgi:hypothetical protein